MDINPAQIEDYRREGWLIVEDVFDWSMDLRYQPADQPSGRSYLPGFIARSRKEHLLRVARLRPVAPKLQWRRSWIDTRLALMDNPPITENRWNTDDPLCA